MIAAVLRGSCTLAESGIGVVGGSVASALSGEAAGIVEDSGACALGREATGIVEGSGSGFRRLHQELETGPGESDFLTRDEQPKSGWSKVTRFPPRVGGIEVTRFPSHLGGIEEI